MRKGAIVIHGLTGTPATMAPVTEALAKSGFKVISPLLPGHGTKKEDLLGVKWADWAKKVEETYQELKASVDEVYCVGISLGSLLTLHLAAQPFCDIKKVACLGLPLKLSSMLENFLLPVSHLPPVRQLLRYSKKDWNASVHDETGLEIYKSTSYGEIPVPSVWELQGLQKDVMSKLTNFSVPTLLIHSRHDKVALPLNVELFIKSAPRTKAEVVWVDNSGHVITLDRDRELVCQKVVEFFA